MKKISNYIFPIFIAASTVLLVVFVSQVSAVDNPPSGQNVPPGLLKKQTLISQQGTSTTSGGKIGQIRKLSGTPPFGRGRLEENKLRLCQVKEKVITNRSNNMVRHANRMLEGFDSIAARIQNYYLTRLVPQEKILPNYDALVLDIQTKKTAVTPLLEAVTADVTNFKCDGDDPKGQLDQFKEDMHAVIAGLKAYKRSVRNLIVAVASIRGAGDGNATGSAAAPSITPSTAPTVEPTAVPTVSQ